MSKYVAGQVIEVANYPFVRDVFNGEDLDGYFQDECWRPGVVFDNEDAEWQQSAVADGVGAMILTVVSTHKPGNFPERVFFTRKWRDPDGKVYGRNKLFVRSEAVFTQLIRGYRHPFGVAE